MPAPRWSVKSGEFASERSREFPSRWQLEDACASPNPKEAHGVQTGGLHLSSGRQHSPLALAEPCSALVPDACPALQLLVIHRLTVVACCHDQHAGGDQLITRTSRRPRIPRPNSDASSLSEHVIIAIGYPAKLGDGLVQAAAFGCVPHRRAVKSAVEQLILGARIPQRIEYEFDWTRGLYICVFEARSGEPSKHLP